MKQIVLGVLAHVDAGKTTLSEAMLYTAGTLRTMGRVDRRDTFLDTHKIERERGITVFSHAARFSVDGTEVTLLDTPGHADFSGETERAVSVLDCAVLLISATDGVQAHTETLWRLLAHYRVPTFIFVTKCDLATAQRERIFRELKTRFGDGVVSFSDADRDEQIALLSESALERYLATGKLADGETKSLIAARRLFPCFFGSGLKNEGVAELLHALAAWTPTRDHGTDFAAKVYKITRDAGGRRLTHMKITGGKLRVRSPLRYRLPDGTETEEKVTQICRYSGEKFDTPEEVTAGEVCAVAGLSATYPGQGLGADADAGLPLLEPVMSYRLRLPEGVDARVAYPKLKELQEEDPQLHLSWDERTREIRVRLMGEVQTEVLHRLIRDRFDMEVTVDGGRIRYRETIAKPVEGAGHYEPLRHYAEVHLLLEPLPRGSGLVFSSNVPTDVLDENWQRLILTHLHEKQHCGVLTGAPVTDMAITLTAGRAHLKHTEGGDFREATYRAVRQGLRKAESILLEPFYAFRIEVPAEEIGRVIGDLRRRACTFEAPEEIGEGYLSVSGRGAVRQLNTYAAALSAGTHGRGRLFCTADGYEPCADAEAVVEEIGYDADRDTENPADSVFCSHGAGHTVPWNEADGYMHVESGIRTEGEQAEREGPPRPRDTRSIDEKEIEAIMEREFGPISRRQYRPTHEVIAEENTAFRRRIRKNWLIVDGYNLLFAGEKEEKLSGDDLALARRKLVHRLRNYQAFTGTEVILVFDAYLVRGNHGSKEEYGGFRIVYTREGETCDAYIEKLLAEMGQNDMVRVATSDALIQLAAVRCGVQRLSSRELMEELAQTEEKITKTIEENNRKP